MASTQSGESKFMPQLDGLRTYAVALVCLLHWVRLGWLPWGKLGVNLFFVLSGFLITRILLNTRSRGAEGSRLHEIRIFYVRRYLRITPVFYGTLAILFVTGSIIIRNTLTWHLFYLSNFLFASMGPSLEYVSHFWSLAVEEQFYLVWPWIVIFLPARHLRAGILSLIVAAPLFRFMTGVFHQPVIGALPIASFDTLGMGAYLAYLGWEEQRTGVPFNRKAFGALALAGLALFALIAGLNLRGDTSLVFLEDTAMAAFFGWLVLSASAGFRGKFAFVVENRVVLYLGKISYGLYIFHNLMPYVVMRLAKIPQLSSLLAHGLSVRIPLFIILTVAVSAGSWHIFEKPINNLKRFFPYVQKPGAPSFAGLWSTWAGWAGALLQLPVSVLTQQRRVPLRQNSNESRHS
jgi:peptidoglycan/LPS O-acetylase OafA/YrhL